MSMQGSEWAGEPHILVVHAAHAPHGPLDDGCLDYDIEHPPGCQEEIIGEGEHAYTQWACDVAYIERDASLPFTLRYSGTPVTELGTYQIQAWGRKYWTECGDEYDNGIGVINPGKDPEGPSWSRLNTRSPEHAPPSTAGPTALTRTGHTTGPAWNAAISTALRRSCNASGQPEPRQTCAAARHLRVKFSSARYACTTSEEPLMSEFTEITFDGCSGEGGAARGYVKAGHHVTGIDNNPAVREGYLRSGAAEFICADVLEVMADISFMSQFTFAHCSFPCQFASALCSCRPGLRETYPNLITPGRPLLNALSIPYVIENVGAARPWLLDPAVFCMWMFGRETYRHRLLEAGGGFSLQPPPAPDWAWHPPSARYRAARRIRVNRECGWPHPVPTARAGHWEPDKFVSVGGHERKAPVQAVMEIDWASNRDAVAEAIPPYLTAYVAEQLAAWRELEAAA